MRKLDNIFAFISANGHIIEQIHVFNYEVYNEEAQSTLNLWYRNPRDAEKIGDFLCPKFDINVIDLNAMHIIVLNHIFTQKYANTFRLGLFEVNASYISEGRYQVIPISPEHPKIFLLRHLQQIDKEIKDIKFMKDGEEIKE